MSARVADFHRLVQRVRLSGVLTTRTALRIGSGDVGAFDAVDLPVIKDVDGCPLIPGGSLKGVVRSTVEALVRGAQAPGTKPRETALWACDPLAENDSELVAKGCGHHEQSQRRDIDPEKHCPVCQLFGSHVIASHVRFCDAMLRISDGDRRRGRIPLEIRDGVSIDRDLRRAAGKRKFDFEVVSPGAEFAVEVFVDNPKPWLMGLLMMGFDQLAEGFTALGGFTSRGLGRVDLRWSSLSRVSASELLSGSSAELMEGEPMIKQMNEWRAALAKECKEASSVSQEL